MEAEIQLAKEGAPTFVFGQRKDPLRILISRTTDATMDGKHAVDDFLGFMGALIKDDNDIFQQYNIDMRTLFINTFKCMDTRLEGLAELKPEGDAAEKLKTRKTNLIAMIKGALERDILTRADCLIHFSSQTLQDAGLIIDKDIFDRRLVRLNTSMIYKQNKFNLFREDNVGYAALINDLIVGSTDHEYDKRNQAPPTSLDRVPTFLQTISSHIGIFHLDPNRVLDILLDFFVKQVLCNYVFWITLFKQSAWMEHLHLGDLPDDGSLVMAHLLGFKFEYYQTIQKENPPKELYYACALLIKEKLIRLHDLLPYLYPFDSAMAQKKKEYMDNMNKEISTNTGGLLAQFGALGEEGTTERVKQPKEKSKSKDEEQEALKANDIVELTRALLAIGDIYHAELLFAKYDKLLDMYPELAHNIYRICDKMLAPIYDTVIPQQVKDKYKLFEQRVQESEIKTALGRSEQEMPELADVLVMDSLRDNTHNISKRERYVFFYRNWPDGIQTVSTFQDLLQVFLPVMRLAGYKMYLAPNLVAKLLLIVRHLIDREEEFPGCRPYCLSMIREILLPSVSFSRCNPGTMASLWELLDKLTFQERYALYGEWGSDFYKKSIECKLLKARTERSVKSVMQRVSRNDVRQCGRDLGKLANSNPTIVFSVMLDQIQSFDNMAPFMADACRYMSDFTYDVLGYLMTEKWTGFNGPGRVKKAKVKEDGMTSTWLRALSVFSGMLFKKQGLDPMPLFRYMILRLHYDDAVDDLILFNEFITKICGIEIIGSTMTDDQILSASCSETIKAEAFQPISGDNRKASKRVITRTKEALQKDGTALELIVLLHRLREACSSEEQISTAALGSRLDLIHQSINQYLEMMTTIFEPQEYDALIPDANTLATVYKLPDYLTMQLVRPKTRHALRTYKPDATETYNADEPHPVFRTLIDQVPAVVTEPSVLNLITSEFYTLFWQLSLYDIHVPEGHYQAAMKRQSDMIAQCRDTRSSFYLNNRPSVVAKAERQAQACLDNLQEDLPRHKADVEKTMQILRTSQARWFPMNVDRQPLISSIIQHCLLPRSMISEADAVFCFEFVMLIHRLGARNFSSLTLFDKVLSENLPTALLSFTEYETTIHARFLYRTFAKISEWQKDEQLYIKEAHGEGLIGFQKKWNAQTSQDVSKEDLLNFPEFKRVMHKWHLKTSLAIEQALQSGEPHQIRNAFLILKQFIPYFPMIREHGQVLVKTTQELANRERKDNLKVLARSYLGLIEKSKSRWVTKDVFLGLKEAEPEKAPSEKASPKPSSNDERITSPDRKRTREDTSNTSTNEGSSSKRSRHDHDDRSSRDASKESRRESERSSARDPSRSARDSSGHRDSRESSSKDQPRIRDHAREAIREAARDSAHARDTNRDSVPRDSGGRLSKESSRSSREERRSSRDRRSTNPGSGSNSTAAAAAAAAAASGSTHNPASTSTNGSSSSKKRDRDDDRDRERGEKRYRDERSGRDDRRERDRERERDRDRERDRERDRDRRRRRR